jgi:hypothetical protein
MIKIKKHARTQNSRYPCRDRSLSRGYGQRPRVARSADVRVTSSASPALKGPDTQSLGELLPSKGVGTLADGSLAVLTERHVLQPSHGCLRAEHPILAAEPTPEQIEHLGRRL